MPEPVEFDLEIIETATGDVVEREQAILTQPVHPDRVRRLAFKYLPTGANAADYVFTLTPCALRKAAHYPETLGEFERVAILEQFGAHALGQPHAFADLWQQPVLAPGEKTKVKTRDPFAGLSAETLEWWAGLPSADRSGIVKRAHAKHLRAQESDK